MLLKGCFMSLSLEGKRILVAEDDYANQKVASLFLEKIGCNTEIAENGQVAVDMVLEGNYDLILMDCRMPVMDGLEATRQIRARENFRVPILAMTANVDHQDKEKCFAVGMDGFVSKPVNLKKLQASICELIFES